MPKHTAKRLRPDEFTGFLLNPHKGCATFQRFNGDPLFEGVRWSEEGPTEFPARQCEGFTPGCDDVVAVILCADGLGSDGFQDTFIEVPLPYEDPIFGDGFESGDTSKWTKTVP